MFLFLSIAAGFNVICYFPVTIHRLDLFSGTYLKKLSVSVLPRDREQLELMGPPSQVLNCLRAETEPGSEPSRVFF